MKQLAAVAVLAAFIAPGAFAQQARCTDDLGTFRVGELLDGDYRWEYRMERVGCTDEWVVKQRCARCNGGQGREETGTFVMTRSGNRVTITTPSCTIIGEFGNFIDAIFAKHNCGCCGGSFISVPSAGIVR